MGDRAHSTASWDSPQISHTKKLQVMCKPEAIVSYPMCR